MKKTKLYAGMLGEKLSENESIVVIKTKLKPKFHIFTSNVQIKYALHQNLHI